MTVEDTLYSSENLLVRRVGGNSRERCIVTFESYIENPMRDEFQRPGFGEAFFRRERIDAIHVLSADNSWYQFPDLPDALSIIRAVTCDYAEVFSYGSSMGGYAAVKFASAAGARTAIAMSPQYSLDPVKVPFETRWSREAARIRFIHDDNPRPASVRAYVFYDPHDDDAMHADLFRRDVPVHDIKLNHAGHPAGTFLAETGLLSTTILDIIGGRFDATAFASAARVGRRNSGKYLITLAQRVSQARYSSKLALARAAVAAAPDQSPYIGYLALLLDHAGFNDEADRSYLAATALAPEDTHLLERHSHLLARGRQFARAVRVARAWSVAAPQSAGAQRHLAGLLAVEGNYQAARQAWHRASAIQQKGPGSPWPLPMMIHARLLALAQHIRFMEARLRHASRARRLRRTQTRPF
jgi:tetratricopeptide (TPR) repeat protein